MDLLFILAVEESSVFLHIQLLLYCKFKPRGTLLPLLFH